MKPENAIQQDANDAGQDQQQDEGQQKFVSARDLAMAAIEQQLEQQYEEMGAIIPDTHDQGNSQQQEQAPAVPATDRQMVKVKVDGEEKELPLEEVAKGYQIEAAARKRLEAASLQMKELEQRERELAEREAQLQGFNHQSGTPSNTDESAVEKARAVLERMLEGDVDDAADMLAGLIGGTKQADAAVDESRISDMISQVEAQREYDRDMKAAKSLFDTEYDEINKDPNLARVANDIFAAELQAGKMPSEAAKAAGNGTREWLRQLTGVGASGASANRIARKQTIDTLPSAGVRSVSTYEGAETASDVIADMRRSRGQVV